MVRKKNQEGRKEEDYYFPRIEQDIKVFLVEFLLYRWSASDRKIFFDKREF